MHTWSLTKRNNSLFLPQMFPQKLYSGLYDEGYLDYDYFGDLEKTFLTLFQFMTLDSWTGVVRQVNDANPYAWVGFLVWVIVTAFFVLNLVIAVICESVIELNNLQEEKRQNKAMKQHRNLILQQTHDLMEETQSISKMQKELLANQLATQQAVTIIAAHLQAMALQQQQQHASDHSDRSSRRESDNSHGYKESLNIQRKERKWSRLPSGTSSRSPPTSN